MRLIRFLLLAAAINSFEHFHTREKVESDVYFSSIAEGKGQRYLLTLLDGSEMRLAGVRNVRTYYGAGRAGRAHLIGVKGYYGRATYCVAEIYFPIPQFARAR